MSVVKVNVLTVPADMREEFERRFANRAGMVESAEGFEAFELLRPAEGTDRYLVYTRWRSEEDFQKWTTSQAFGQGHAQAGGSVGQGSAAAHDEAPKARPAASGSELWSFEVIQSAAPKS